MNRRAVIEGTAKLAAAAAALSAGPASADMGVEASAPGALHLPARVIPVPKSVDEVAQKFLAEGAARRVADVGPTPPVSDKAAWKARIAAMDAIFDPMVDRMLALPAKARRTILGGANVCVGTPDVMRHPDRARLGIHGGGWTLLGGRFVMGDAAQMAADSGCTTFSVDYRMPPDFPFPAGLDDCVAAYREIIKTYDPKKVAISGASAGGNLTGAVVLKIRDLGLPLPGAVGMMTPVTDLTSSGDTRQTNYGVDVVLNWPPDEPNPSIEIYAGGHDLKDPYVSPLFGDLTKGFPPTFLQSGTRDVLLSDTVRMHRALLRAGAEAELHVWEAMPHGGFGGASPADVEIRQQFQRFIDKHMG
jgi:acetyl esterase/lipase